MRLRSLKVVFKVTLRLETVVAIANEDDAWSCGKLLLVATEVIEHLAQPCRKNWARKKCVREQERQKPWWSLFLFSIWRTMADEMQWKTNNGSFVLVAVLSPKKELVAVLPYIMNIILNFFHNKHCPPYYTWLFSFGCAGLFYLKHLLRVHSDGAMPLILNNTSFNLEYNANSENK